MWTLRKFEIRPVKNKAFVVVASVAFTHIKYNSIRKVLMGLTSNYVISRIYDLWKITNILKTREHGIQNK